MFSKRNGTCEWLYTNRKFQFNRPDAELETVPKFVESISNSIQVVWDQFAPVFVQKYHKTWIVVNETILYFC